MSNEDANKSGAYLGTRMGRSHQNAYQQMLQQATMAATNAVSDPDVRAKLNASLPITHLDDYPSDRRDLGMYSENAQPTIWDAVNYPRDHEFEFESFFLRYERQSEARAIIDKPVNDTWQSDPKIHDEANEDNDEDQTEFEEEVKEFMAGEHTRRKPIHRFNVADRLARIGHYSLLVIGTQDGRDLSEPLKKQEFAEQGLDALNFLATFGEDRIIDIETDSDLSSPRFRLPEMFEVITEDPADDDREGDDPGDFDSEFIHWSRVIHIPEGTLEDDLKGTPAMKPVFHELLNIDKIKAASAEGFWRAGYQGLLIRPPMDPNTDTRMKFSDDAEGVEAEIEEFMNNFQRTIATRADVEPLSSNVGNPGPHLEANYQSIAAALDIPKSILTGKEMADTGASNDVRQWHQKIGQRRNGFAGPVILEPLIQRFIDIGILPKPEGDGFIVDWQPLDEMSETQEAELHQTKASTLGTLAGGDPSRIASMAELRQVIGWGPELGSEVDEDDQPDQSELEVDESQLEENLDVPRDDEGVDDQQEPGSGVADVPDGDSGDSDPTREPTPSGTGQSPTANAADLKARIRAKLNTANTDDEMPEWWSDLDFGQAAD